MSSQLTLPSNRRFGLTLGAALAGIGLFLVLRGAIVVGPVLLAIAIFLVGMAILFERRLETANRAWMRFGVLLGSVVSPVVLALVYFLMLTPLALYLKVIGRDELRLKKRKLESHWINVRDDANTMRNFEKQF